MIRHAAEPADATFNKIKTMMNTVKGKFEPDLAQLGFQISPNMEKGTVSNAFITWYPQWSDFVAHSSV